MSITIKDVAVAVAEETGLPKKSVLAVIESTFGFVSGAIQDRQDVTIHNFGRFHVKMRNARNARNPRTGEAILVPAKEVIKFTPRGTLK